MRRFEDVVLRARAERDVALVRALEHDLKPVRFEPGRIEIALMPSAEPDLPQRLGQAMQRWTGSRWIVSITQAPEGAETIREARQKSRAAIMAEASADPLVRQVLERFPGAEVVDVRARGNAGQAATGAEPETNGGED
jgi:DNA polymerase-3 subunit gamma/tau